MKKNIIKPKDIELEAVQWTDNYDEMKLFCGDCCSITREYATGIELFWSLIIYADDRDIVVAFSDWVVKLDACTFTVVSNENLHKFFNISQN